MKLSLPTLTVVPMGCLCALMLGARATAPNSADLIDRLSDPAPSVRTQAIKALAHSSEPLAFEALVAQCKVRNLAFRWQVGEAIGEAQNHHVVPKLRSVLREGDDWRAQEMAVVALARLHHTLGIEPLLESHSE